jgi:hypothetical protein
MRTAKSGRLSEQVAAMCDRATQTPVQTSPHRIVE